jgi:hypothetical protein
VAVYRACQRPSGSGRDPTVPSPALRFVIASTIHAFAIDWHQRWHQLR